MLDNTEYIPLEEDSLVKDREQAWLRGESDEEEEETFDWVDEQRFQDQAKFEEETYFTLVSEMRRPMKKGEQAWNCYGNRTNSYLLINYGFCFQGNLYNSVQLMVKLDLTVGE
jgi:hypothetical protein